MARTKKNLEDINIDDLLNDLDKQYSSTKQLPRIRSNILSLDIVLGGQGIPQGKMIEICSASGVGKSTLMLHASKNLCAQGYRVIWIDTEYATDDELLNKMGLTEYQESGLFKIYRISTFTKVENVLDTLLPTKQVKFVVIDSIANLTSEAQQASTVYQKDIAKSIDIKQVAGDARTQTLFMKKYKAMCSENDVTMFCINQYRQFIPTGYGQVAKEVASGAKAVKYSQDCIIDLIPAGKIKGKKQTINGTEEIDIGSNVFFYIKEKSRISPGGVKVPGAIYFGQGFSNISTLKILMEMKKVPFEGRMVKMLTQSGQTYTLTFGGKQVKATYQTGLRKAIGENYDELMAEFTGEDFNVIKDEFDETVHNIDINEDPVSDEDEVIYDNDGNEITSYDVDENEDVTSDNEDGVISYNIEDIKDKMKSTKDSEYKNIMARYN